MDNDVIKWFIRIATTLMIIPAVIALPWSMITAKTFSAEYSAITIMLIIIIWLLFKIDNLIGIAALFGITSCILIYLGSNNDPNLKAVTHANNVISENILSIDYTSNDSDILHIGFDNKYYYVFTKDNTGTIELIKLPCDDTIIKEVDNIQKPTYNYKKPPMNQITDREITVTKGKYKLIKQ